MFFIKYSCYGAFLMDLWLCVFMVSCMSCQYCSSSGGVYIVCRYFNKVINLKHFDGCPSYKGKNFKAGLSRDIS